MAAQTITIPDQGELPENAVVVATLKEIEDAANILREKLAELHRTVKDIQSECPHETVQKVVVRDPNYIWAFYRDDKQQVLAKKICTTCKIVLTRPKGDPWTVCHQCWGKQKKVADIPGQGHTTRIYECEQCGHETSHT